ncbi:toprim domain-containing protein [Flavobacterium granuli]|uniref:CHC2 zinc finger n=1 Tax=Flavobacterium granuli TaxID=280093 RepID=A0A1M5RST0_9FLAO|nr:toprim domain-containing protein [Flavobacterium granuli]PRZ22764.1 CHC2-type zinc finger protein [Flavobacterium granuli]SHH29209.1 CHC2 zinc finger [Flavobacterium granuli]
MNFSNHNMTIAQAKTLDLINYLAVLGFKPSKIKGSDFWFLSPLRVEKTPSFKVNQKLNCWYDHGIGKGGNLIAFGLLYYNCSISELLQNLSHTFSLQKPITQHANEDPKRTYKIQILKEEPLASPSLLRYLEQRRIPIKIAQQFCVEIRYALNKNTYYGIGFKNDLGGFEIRNPYFKTSSSPKGITSFDNCSNEVVVFEGFIDFLSFKATTKNLPENSQDFVVLNSVSFFERARPFMENHQSIRLFLDRDETGQNYTSRALSLSTKYTDESKLYEHYKDLNDWSMNCGKSAKRHLGRKL